MAVSDTKNWLQNKLGSTSELWNGESVSPFWTEDRLMSIQDCFHSFPPHIQVMILTSFLHIPVRNVMMWKNVLEEIISLAEEVPDPWVCTVGEIMKKFPSTGQLNTELEGSSTFSEVLADLKKLVRKSADMPPLECPYLNKTALASTVSNTPTHEKRFNLRRKPKSAALRAELLQKANEVANNKKNNVANSVPIKVRSFAKKMDDTTPMKPIPNRAAVPSGFRTPSSGLARLAAVGPIGSNTIGGRSASSRKEGGIKFLDITEQPVGAKEAKRRKKQHEQEMMEHQKKEKEAAAAAAAAVAASVAATTTAPAATPDYAAGLISPATPKVATLVVGANTTTLAATTPSFPAGTTTSRITIQPTSTPTITSVTLSSATTAQLRQNLQQQLDQQLSQAGNRVTSLVGTPLTQSQTIILSSPLGSQASPITLVTQKVVAKPGTTPITTTATVVAVATTAVPTTAIPGITVAATVPATAATATQAPVKRGLSLTRDQMLEAQEMFKTSNRVTRPEKALILGFMAGSRENPCPAQGAILNIRLSENEEVVNIGSVEKTMVAETFFQMNYQTGQWKRFKKLREVDKKQTVTAAL